MDECLEALAVELTASRRSNQQLQEQVSQHQKQISQHQEHISQHQEHISALEQRLLSSQQVILLGQVAYRLDAIVAKYVFADEKGLQRTPVIMISQYTANGELSEKQGLRWAKVNTFFNSRGFSMMKLTSTQQALKQPRMAVAQGSQAEQSAENKVSLLAHAAAIYSDDSDDTVDAAELIELLCSIAGEEQPLTATVDLSAAING
jgi:septal ring factor EnvC (AmiA/AmiB activator)